jgi:hypothetical protein
VTLVEVFLYLAPVVLGVLSVPFAIHAERNARRRTFATWRSVAEEVGVHGIDEVSLKRGNLRLEGRIRHCAVRIERILHSKHASSTDVVVRGNSGMTLRPEERYARSKEREREIELGDEAFDAAVEIHGAPDRVRALLDVETRVAVRRMLLGLVDGPTGQPVPTAAAIALLAGELVAQFPDQPTPPAPWQLKQALQALLDLSERFQRPSNVAERLARTLEVEPHWRVRLRGLELLATSYPKDPATRAAARHALADALPEIRLEAAIALGDDGVPALLEIARLEGVEDATAARAIDALGDRFPAESRESALHQALRLRRLHTADACIQALGRGGGAAAVRRLAKVLAVETGPLAVAAAKALGTAGAGSQEAESALLSALAKDLPDLVVPAVEALGHVGSARAVLPIQEAAARYGSHTEVRRAARQAVAEIQARLPGATPGQLSIAEAEAGALSLADDDPRGRVSLPGAG